MTVNEMGHVHVLTTRPTLRCWMSEPVSGVVSSVVACVHDSLTLNEATDSLFTAIGPRVLMTHVTIARKLNLFKNAKLSQVRLQIVTCAYIAPTVMVGYLAQWRNVRSEV